MRRTTGSSLLEVLVMLGVATALLGAVAPEWVRWRQSYRLGAAARTLALTIGALRTRAAVEGIGYGLRFVTGNGGLAWEIVRDDNGNGIRTAEIRSGVDPVVGPTTDLGQLYPGLAPGLPDGIRGPTGSRPDDGVALGRADILSLRPHGAATAGTIYLRDGFGAAAAVVIYGPTGRVTVWRYRPERGRWESR